MLDYPCHEMTKLHQNYIKLPTEGTTQGDSIIILIYVLRSLLLLNMTITDSTKVSTFVEDISCVGKLKNIKLGGKY